MPAAIAQLKFLEFVDELPGAEDIGHVQTKTNCVRANVSAQRCHARFAPRQNQAGLLREIPVHIQESRRASLLRIFPGDAVERELAVIAHGSAVGQRVVPNRSEEHTSELQSPY